MAIYFFDIICESRYLGTNLSLYQGTLTLSSLFREIAISAFLSPNRRCALIFKKFEQIIYEMYLWKLANTIRVCVHLPRENIYVNKHSCKSWIILNLRLNISQKKYFYDLENIFFQKSSFSKKLRKNIFPPKNDFLKNVLVMKKT